MPEITLLVPMDNSVLASYNLNPRHHRMHKTQEMRFGGKLWDFLSEPQFYQV